MGGLLLADEKNRRWHLVFRTRDWPFGFDALTFMVLRSVVAVHVSGDYFLNDFHILFLFLVKVAHIWKVSIPAWYSLLKFYNFFNSFIEWLSYL